MDASCQIGSTLQQERLWFLVTETLIGAVIIVLLIWIIRLIDRTEESKLARLSFFMISILASIFLFGSVSIVAIVVLILTGHISTDNPPSYAYHVLNAAIKNTCYLDPQRNHCPKSVEELISIEDKNFTELTKDAHLTYKYYPQTNEYTLIVRNNNLKENNYRVAIFDPRLQTAKNYGRGLDFVDEQVVWCSEKYVLKNPPPFPGPWDKIN